jgi:anti-sigma B factor antagonist
MRNGQWVPASNVSAQTLDLGGQESFAVAVSRRDGLVIVHPRGALDIVSVETLRAVLDDVPATGGLVLDLRGLSFIDSSGLHLLVALDRRARRDGLELSLVAPPAPVDSAIRLCGLDQVLPFVTDVEDVGAS